MKIKEYKTKICTKCNTSKPATLDYFYKHSKNTLRPDCKDCTNKRNEIYKQKNLNKILKYQKEYKKEYSKQNYDYIKQQNFIYRQNNRDIINKNNREKYLYNHNDLIKKQKQHYLKYEKTLSARYRTYKSGAKKRNIDFNLTKNDFSILWQQNCFYCDSAIPTIGIDRIDNSKGYDLHNIVPCCKHCNLAKRELSYIDYINFCTKIALNHNPNLVLKE